jgi:hypothetical protein
MYETPPVEKNGAQVELVFPDGSLVHTDDFLAQRKAAALAGQAYAPILGFETTGNLKLKYPYNPFKGGWSPRVSVAWNPNFKSGFLSKLFGQGDTVLRGGYGILYAVDTNLTQPLTSNPGTGSASYACTPITNPSGCPAVFQARNPFDAGIPTAPFTVAAPGSSFAVPTNGGLILFTDPDRKDEMYQQYNFTIQDEFRSGWLGEVGYVGARGRNLLVLQNIGTGNDQGGPGSREIVLVNVTNSNPITATRYRGKSNYNALQTKLEKRFAKGLALLSSYTWAHSIDDAPGGVCANGAGPRDCGPDDPLRPELERGNSEWDVRHRFTFSNVWDIPIGRNRRYGSDMHKALDAAVGGWQFNNIITWQSGPVFNVTCNGGRVDLIGDPTPTDAQRAQGRELNPNAFRCPTTRVFAGDPDILSNGAASPKIGSLGRNVFRGRQQFYWDSSLYKNFPISAISEAFNIQFRFSAYNVLNRVNRSFPNGDLNSGDFGIDTSEQRRRQMEFSLRFIF